MLLDCSRSFDFFFFSFSFFNYFYPLKKSWVVLRRLGLVSFQTLQTWVSFKACSEIKMNCVSPQHWRGMRINVTHSFQKLLKEIEALLCVKWNTHWGSRENLLCSVCFEAFSVLLKWIQVLTCTILLLIILLLCQSITAHMFM